MVTDLDYPYESIAFSDLFIMTPRYTCPMNMNGVALECAAVGSARLTKKEF